MKREPKNDTKQRKSSGTVRSRDTKAAGRSGFSTLFLMEKEKSD